MSEIIPQDHGGAINRFSKGESGNPAGRPKRIYTVLKESGYTKDDIRDAFEEIGWQTIDDLEAIAADPGKPAILKVIAQAFISGAKKGDFRYVSEILQHVMGKPKETVEANITQRKYSITLNLNRGDRGPKD